MRFLTATNRTIVAQLVEPYEDMTDDVAVPLRSTLATRSDRLLRYVTPRELKVFTIITCFVAGLLSAVVSPLAGILALAAGVMWMLMLLRRRERRRSDAIDRDLPALLTAIASSVRAGIDPLRAISDAEEYLLADSPLVREIRLFKQRLASGEDEFGVVEKFLIDDNHRDAELFKQCLLLSRRHGSSLAEPLHRVVRVVRQRQSFKRKTRAALAMHQMSAFGIMLCAILISAMQLVVNVDGVKVAIQDPRGVVLLSVGGALILIGVFWMTRMGKEEKL